jgi:hypothetical protein
MTRVLWKNYTPKPVKPAPVQENTMIYKTFEQWKSGNVLEHGVPRTEYYSEDQLDLVEMGWNYGYDAGRAVEQALDKKAENARELGLDYEPVQEPDLIARLKHPEDHYEFTDPKKANAVLMSLCQEAADALKTSEALVRADERETFNKERQQYADWLDEAAADIEDWGMYASEYLQKKWDLPDQVQDYKNRAAAIRARGQT